MNNPLGLPKKAEFFSNLIGYFCNGKCSSSFVAKIIYFLSKSQHMIIANKRSQRSITFEIYCSDFHKLRRTLNSVVIVRAAKNMRKFIHTKKIFFNAIGRHHTFLTKPILGKAFNVKFPHSAKYSLCFKIGINI